MTDKLRQTGQAAIDQMGQEPTLDAFFDRNPATLSDAELLALIEVERRNRAIFIEKKGK